MKLLLSSLLLAGVTFIEACSLEPVGWDRLPPNPARIETEAFSYNPPIGTNWGRMRATPAEALQAFVKLTDGRPHSIYATVALVYVDSAKEDRALFDEQTTTLKAEDHGPRFQNARGDYQQVKAAGSQCLRVDTSVDDVGSKATPGQPLELTLHALHCRHPTIRGLIVSLAISERWLPGTPAALSQEEVASFLGSLTFNHSSLQMAAVNMGRHPFSIASNPDAVWVAVTGEDSVKRIDPKTLQITATTVTGKDTFAVVTTKEGTWVSTQKAVLLLDSKTAQVIDRIPFEANPSYLSAAPTAVWVSFPVGKQVSRIDTVSHHVDTLAFDGKPQGLQADANGAWISIADPPGVTFVRNAGLVRESTVPLPSPQMPHRDFGGLVLRAFGSVWVGDFPTHVVHRVDATSGKVLATIDVGQNPAFLVEFQGNVVVSLMGDNSLVRINPQTNQLAGKPMLIGSHPLELAASGNTLWAVVRDNGLVVRITP